MYFSGCLTNGIASNPSVSKFVENLAAKPVETSKLKITTMTKLTHQSVTTT